jgi:signal transduction histidine kinase
MRAIPLIRNIPRAQRLSMFLAIVTIAATFVSFIFLPKDVINFPAILLTTAGVILFTAIYYGIPGLQLKPNLFLLADMVYISALTLALFFLGPYFPYYFYLYFLLLTGDAWTYDAKTYRIVVELIILSIGIRHLFDPNLFTSTGIALLLVEYVAIILLGSFIWVFASEAVVERARRVRAEREAKRLAELERLKADFLALASHEMRTPLGHIKGYIEVLRKKRDLNAIERIEANTDRLLRLVSQMLSVSKIEQEKIREIRSDVDLGTLLPQVVEEFRRQAETKRISLSVTKPSKDSLVVGSSEDLKDAFSNLVDNALRYTGSGGTVTLSASVHGGRVLAQVKDSGIGIPREEQHNLFKRFFRATNAQKLEPSGNGLGLYLVKEIVERNRGSITVESEEGKGTTFLISLPKKGAV